MANPTTVQNAEQQTRWAVWMQRLGEPHRLPGHVFRGLRRRLVPPDPARPAPLPPWPGVEQRSFAERFGQVPPHLVYKVNGTLEEEVFRNVGRLTAATLQDQLGIADARRVLDFGCGLGRTLLALRAAASGPSYVAYDIDPLMVEWCRYLLHGGPTRIDYTGSSQTLPDGGHDVVYAISVFTHIDQLSEYWLAELHRLLAPTGRALLTYLDDTLFNEHRGTATLPHTTPDSVLRTKYVSGGGNTEGGTGLGVYYTTPYWEEQLGRYFHIEHTLPRGLFGHQSFSVVRPKAVTPDWAGLRRQYVEHLEQELFELRKTQGVLF